MTIVQQTPFLPTSKSFPTDIAELSETLTKTYTEIAIAMNARMIGVFDTQQVNTGQRWPSSGVGSDRRQAFRTVYVFGANPAPFPHGLVGVTQYVLITAIIKTATFSSSLPYVDPTDITKCIGFFVDSTNINIVRGAGADNIVSGTIDLEYLYN